MQVGTYVYSRADGELPTSNHQVKQGAHRQRQQLTPLLYAQSAWCTTHLCHALEQLDAAPREAPHQLQHIGVA